MFMYGIIFIKLFNEMLMMNFHIKNVRNLFLYFIYYYFNLLPLNNL